MILNCKIHISGNVIFQENEFAYHNNVIIHPLVPMPTIPANNDVQFKDIGNFAITDLDISPATTFDASPATNLIVQP